jgi:Glucodextranase, domain B/PASTA domain
MAIIVPQPPGPAGPGPWAGSTGSASLDFVRRLAPPVLLLALTGCAGEHAPSPLPPPVKITLAAPDDRAVVRDAVVEVRGTVSPAAARVTVLGVPAAVSDGSFSARVPLAEGPNVVDVAATASGSSPGLAALRVTREVRVNVPDLIGEPAGEALDALAKLGLKAQEERGGGLFDGLLPGERKVCDTDPRGGAQVRPRTEVRVLTAKSC